MNAKSIYDKLVNVEGIPSSILTYSDKNDCIIIEVQDYDKSVFKFAQKFFNGYKSVDIDYTNENKTSVWYNDVSEYSDRETIDSITRFYYDMKVKGLVESKKSARNSIKESYLDEVTNLYFFDLDVDEECEVQLENFVMPCRISQFYKNDRHMYLIVQSKTSDETYFVITYNYKKNKFVSSKVFSSYREAKNQLVDTIAMVF